MVETFLSLQIETGQLVTVFLDACIDGTPTLDGVLINREGQTITLQDEHGRWLEVPWTRIVALRRGA